MSGYLFVHGIHVNFLFVFLSFLYVLCVYILINGFMYLENVFIHVRLSFHSGNTESESTTSRSGDGMTYNRLRQCSMGGFKFFSPRSTVDIHSSRRFLNFRTKF